MKKIAIVTGASSGIGKEFFLSLNERKEGLDEIWVIARSANKLEELRTQTDIPLRVIPLDLSAATATEELEKAFTEEQPSIQYLICASGFGRFNAIEDDSAAVLENMVDLNCRSIVGITRAAFPYMAKGGTVTSTIAIGINKSEATAIAELEKISAAGKGKIFLVNNATDLEEDLTEIAESIQGKLLNTDITVLPMRDSLNSIVHEGVREYDEIHGYYGTTIKDGAERVIYVDNLRPLYAEWEYGLGKVCALMTDLGNVDWTGEMFDDTDGVENVRSNILLSPIYKRVDSTGLDYTVTRDDKRIDMTVMTPVDLGTRNQAVDGISYEEVIRASVYKFDQTKKIWVAYGTFHATPLANCKYQVTIPTGSIEETYVIVLDLYKAQVGYNSAGNKAYSPIEYAVHGDDPLRDTTALAVVGKTLEEYDILRGGSDAGRDLMEGLVTSKLDGLVNGNDYNLDEMFRKEEGEDKTVTEDYNIDIPLIAIALILFVLDIIFRNFVIKKKSKNKGGYKTDEEVYESMRGR